MMTRSVANFRIILFAAIVGMAPAWAVDDYKQLNSDAIAAMRSGGLDQAEELFKKALAASQDSSDHYDNTIKTNLAILYRKMGKSEQADALDKEVAAAEGKPAPSTSTAAHPGLSPAQYIDFAQRQTNLLVSIKLCRKVNVIISSARLLRRTNDGAVVSVNGTTSGQVVQLEVVVANAPSGLAVASSRCETFVPIEAANMKMSMANAPTTSLFSASPTAPTPSAPPQAPAQEEQVQVQRGGPKISGRLRVIDFSTSWCKYCKKFSPDFHDVANRYGSSADFETLDGDDPAVAPLKQKYGVHGYPTIVFTDSSSQMLHVMRGAPSKEEFEDAVKQLLAP